VTLRVGVVGAGNIFERGYVPALRATDAVRVTAICDLDPGRAAAGAALLGSARVAASDAELFAFEDLDAVFILTPTHTHADLAVAALEAGRHVLCEKPMARSAADARRMAAAAERTGRRLMIGHARRFERFVGHRHLDALALHQIDKPAVAVAVGHGRQQERFAERPLI